MWLASTIAGQSFLPEEHWRAMEPIIREELLPIADTWGVEEDGELVAFWGRRRAASDRIRPVLVAEAHAATP